MYQGLTTAQTAGLGAFQMGAIGLQTYFAFSAAKAQNKALMQNAANQAEAQRKQITKLMGQQTLSYLKSGIGISGSALDVIETTGKEGLKDISNQLDYTVSQIKDNLRGIRNQAISSVIGSAIQTGVGMYASNEYAKQANYNSTYQGQAQGFNSQMNVGRADLTIK